MQLSNGYSIPSYHQENRILDAHGNPYGQGDAANSPYALPHVYTFTSIISTAWHAYYQSRYDEAMRAGREQARAMFNDAYLRALLRERMDAVASLKWHLEIDDIRDKTLVAVKDGLTQIIKTTPRLQDLIHYLLWAIWYGRYGSQVTYQWKDLNLPSVKDRNSAPNPMTGEKPAVRREKRKALTINNHEPVNGDKIGHQHDGTPFVLVHATYVPGSLPAGTRFASSEDMPGNKFNRQGERTESIWTDVGKAMLLKGTWRSRFILHRHEPIDADYFDAESAEAIHGVGIRSVIYWWWWLKLEWISNVADWCERTGLGIRLWYYQGGNDRSRKEIAQAAKEQSDKVNILIPRYGDRHSEGVEYVDTASAGADLLLRLVEYVDKIIERYIIGQTLSSGTEGSGLGGTGVSDLHASTKEKIISLDANRLAESLTEDMVKVLLRHTYKDFGDLPIRWVFETDQPNVQEKMGAIQAYISMGGEVIDDEVRALVGLSVPEEGDKILKRPEMMGPGAEGGGAPPPDAPLTPEEEGLTRELFGDEADEVLKDVGHGEEENPEKDPEKYIRADEPIYYGNPNPQHVPAGKQVISSATGQPIEPGEFAPKEGSEQQIPGQQQGAQQPAQPGQAQQAMPPPASPQEAMQRAKRAVLKGVLGQWKEAKRSLSGEALAAVNNQLKGIVKAVKGTGQSTHEVRKPEEIVNKGAQAAKAGQLDEREIGLAKWAMKEDWDYSDEEIAQFSPERIAALIERKYDGGIKAFKVNNTDDIPSGDQSMLDEADAEDVFETERQNNWKEQGKEAPPLAQPEGAGLESIRGKPVDQIKAFLGRGVKTQEDMDKARSSMDHEGIKRAVAEIGKGNRESVQAAMKDIGLSYLPSEGKGALLHKLERHLGNVKLSSDQTSFSLSKPPQEDIEGIKKEIMGMSSMDRGKHEANIGAAQKKIESMPPHAKEAEVAQKVGEAVQGNKNAFQSKNLKQLYEEIGRPAGMGIKEFQGTLLRMQEQGKLLLGSYTQAIGQHEAPEHLLPAHGGFRYYAERPHETRSPTEIVNKPRQYQMGLEIPDTPLIMEDKKKVVVKEEEIVRNPDKTLQKIVRREWEE